MSDFWLDPSSTSILCVCEQQRLSRDWADATSWKNLFMFYANNKGVYQPTHPCSLISTFVVRCLDSISVAAIATFRRLLLASIAEQASLSLSWSHTSADRFSLVVAHFWTSTWSYIDQSVTHVNQESLKMWTRLYQKWEIVAGHKRLVGTWMEVIFE